MVAASVTQCDAGAEGCHQRWCPCACWPGHTYDASCAAASPAGFAFSLHASISSHQSIVNMTSYLSGQLAVFCLPSRLIRSDQFSVGILICLPVCPAFWWSCCQYEQTCLCFWRSVLLAMSLAACLAVHLSGCFDGWLPDALQEHLDLLKSDKRWCWLCVISPCVNVQLLCRRSWLRV